jgi:hypothetical protein
MPRIEDVLERESRTVELEQGDFERLLGRRDHDPKWMPDGTSVWLEGWELPLDGSPPRRLPSRGGDPYATYSPDGSLVAYGDIGGLGLMVTRSDRSEPRRVFPRRVGLGDDWGHPWSPTAIGSRSPPRSVALLLPWK